MVLPDVNVLLFAHRTESSNHNAYRAWLESLWSGPASYGYSSLVLSSFVRIVTHPRVFDPPTPIETALAFAGQIRTHSKAVEIVPGKRHWPIFQDLCKAANVTGNLVSDAYLAALAIESGSEWITADRDFARFPGLRWRHPIQG